jgi:hypothetical protein
MDVITEILLIEIVNETTSSFWLLTGCIEESIYVIYLEISHYINI